MVPVANLDFRHIERGLSSQLNVAVVQWFIDGCSRRSKANDGAAERRARGRRWGVGVFNKTKPGTTAAPSRADDPDVAHEGFVTCSFLGADGAGTILTADDDHYMELMDGAYVGPQWIGVCDAEGACDIVPDGGFHRFRSRRRCDGPTRILDGRSFGADGPGSAGSDKQGEGTAGVGDFLASGVALTKQTHVAKTGAALCWRIHRTFSDSVASVPATAFIASRKILHKGGESRRWFADVAKELVWGRMNTLCQSLSLFGSSWDAVVCRSSRQGEGGARRLASACKNVRSRRQST